MRDWLIAAVAVVLILAAVCWAWRRYLARKDDFEIDDVLPDWYRPGGPYGPIDDDDDLDDETTDDAWADELHAIARDLPGPAEARSDRAGECHLCGAFHDDETRIDPDWFGRWEIEQAEWMEGFHQDRNAVDEWLASA